MHPSAVLLICLMALVSIQFLGWWAATALLAVLLVAGGGNAHWWRLLRRMRWLLLSIWLIIAYGVPGDALFDQGWMPTYQGAVEASLHAFRLILMLGCLGAMFARLGNRGLANALFGLLKPLGRIGLNGDAWVVRLTLVMQNLEQPLPKGAWRTMLAGHLDASEGPAQIAISVRPWRTGDYLACAAMLIALCGALVIGRVAS